MREIDVRGEVKCKEKRVLEGIGQEAGGQIGNLYIGVKKSIILSPAVRLTSITPKSITKRRTVTQPIDHQRALQLRCAKSIYQKPT